MIKATFQKRDGHYVSFEIAGHSGYSEEGSDIVCAAVSGMCSLSANILESLSGVTAEAFSDESIPLIRCKIIDFGEKAEYTDAVVSSFEQALRDLAVDFGKYVRVYVKCEK